MVYRDTLTVFLNKYFAPFSEKAKKDPYLSNGLQFEGKEEIKKIVLGVSADLDFFQKAVKKNADCLIVHHGLDLNLANQRIDSLLKERLKILFEKNLTLFGYHFLLDHHPDIGNNAWVLKKLGGEDLESFHDEWGWYGQLKEKTSVAEIIKQAEKIYGTKSYLVLKGEKKIKTIAVCSGAGAPHSSAFSEYLDKKIDLLITGVVMEDTPALFSESKINFASFGHYATEKVGIKNLGEIIKKQFYVEVEFVDTGSTL